MHVVNNFYMSLKTYGMLLSHVYMFDICCMLFYKKVF